MAELTEQELHNLAMNIVGEELEAEGYEFLGVNSELQKNPQFVVVKNKVIHFIVVRVVLYPDEPHEYDADLMQKMKDHAEKFDAKAFYAGVGLGHGSDYEKPVIKDEPYGLIYNGLIEIE